MMHGSDSCVYQWCVKTKFILKTRPCYEFFFFKSDVIKGGQIDVFSPLASQNCPLQGEFSILLFCLMRAILFQPNEIFPEKMGINVSLLLNVSTLFTLGEVCHCWSNENFSGH